MGKVNRMYGCGIAVLLCFELFVTISCIYTYFEIRDVYNLTGLGGKLWHCINYNYCDKVALYEHDVSVLQVCTWN